MMKYAIGILATAVSRFEITTTWACDSTIFAVNQNSGCVTSAKINTQLFRGEIKLQDKTSTPSKYTMIGTTV